MLKNETITFSGRGETITFSGRGETITISGRGETITISGMEDVRTVYLLMVLICKIIIISIQLELLFCYYY